MVLIVNRMSLHEDEDTDDNASILSEESIEELLDTSEEEEEEEPSARKTRKQKKKLGKKAKKKTSVTTEGTDGKKTKPMTEKELNDVSFEDLHDLAKGMLRTRGGAKGDEPTVSTAREHAARQMGESKTKRGERRWAHTQQLSW